MTHCFPDGLRRRGALLCSLVLLAVLACFFPWTGGVSAQETGDPPPTADAPEEKVREGHSYHGEAFNDGPRQAAYLMGGTGRVHFPVTTAHAEAQALFDQGVGQLHGFWYFEAERSFRQVLALDPDCVMAYWGLALANANNEKRADDFIAEASARRENVSDRERRYIDALAEYLGADSKDGKARSQRYVKALEGILHEHPDDVEAKALLVLQQWLNQRSGIPISSFLAVDALLEQIFAANPEHPAHHYRIHLWDGERPEKALAAAAACGAAGPSIAHMWHMSGHIYSKLKRYHDAAWQQEASARVDHSHMMRDRVLPDQIHNFAHNNEWLIRNLLFVGRVRDAVDLAKNMTELPRHPRFNTLAKRSSSSSYGRRRLFESLSQYELWDELVALSDTHYLARTGIEREDLERLRYLGEAHARRGDLENATAVLISLEEQKHQVEVRRDHAVRQARALEREKAAKSADEESEVEAASLADGRDVDGETGSGDASEPEADEPEVDEPEAEKDEEDAKEDAELEKNVKKAGERAKRRFESSLRDLDRACAFVRGHIAVVDGALEAGLEDLERGGADDLYLARLRVVATREEISPASDRVDPVDAATDAPAAHGATTPAAGCDDDAPGGATEEPEEKHEEEKEDRHAKALESFEKLVSRHESEVRYLAAAVEMRFEEADLDGARTAFDRLREDSEPIDLDSPVFERLGPAARAFELPSDWRLPLEREDDFGERPTLDSLGPYRWSPSPAPEFSLEDSFGGVHSSAKLKGRPHVLIFYLGHECLHCAEQLHAFAPRVEEFERAGLSILAISTNRREDLKFSIETFGDAGFPFPLVADPDLAVFKSHRVHDDFEKLPLHGTFLIDAEGLVRWQDISFEPFMDPQFVLDEWARLNAGGGLLAPARRERL